MTSEELHIGQWGLDKDHIRGWPLENIRDIDRLTMFKPESKGAEGHTVTPSST